MPIQKVAAIMRPSEASGAAMPTTEKSTHFMQMASMDQPSSSHQAHAFGPQHMKQASYHHYLAEGKSR